MKTARIFISSPGDVGAEREKARDIFRALDSFGRELEGPGDNERDGKSNYDREHDQPHRPTRDLKERENLRRDLDEQPRHNRISDGNLVDVAPLQLGEEGRFFAHFVGS
jgi:hypothetical protein